MIEIPSNIYVPCPKSRFMLRCAAKQCIGCERFDGLVKISEEGDWTSMYRILCAEPIARRCQMVEVG